MDVAEFDLVMQSDLFAIRLVVEGINGVISCIGGTNIMTTKHSNSNSRSNMKEFKRHRLTFAESSDSSRRDKGVVQRQNGHYDKEAAMVYDSAAMKLRNDDYSQRNIPLNNLTLQEHNFQSLHTTDEILCMIKDGSYQAKFIDFVSTQSVAIESKAVENAW
ncbi:hypothetical protein Sjap_014767 [Stephania japonica]|uniref:Uncharacterized protein n=1 Tax=Stephania japonica TaxID=461633 RepID=A0AAP0IIC9_9MAGN